jgi:hypothetical protein
MKKELLDENSHIEVNIHRVVNTWYVLPCVGCHALDRYLPNAVWILIVAIVDFFA